MSARGSCNGQHAVDSGCADPECYRFDEPMIHATVLGARLELRKKALADNPDSKDWTQADLAARVNRMLPRHDEDGDPGFTSAQYISDVEHGRRRPGLFRLRALADALGTSMDWLCGREEREGKRFPFLRAGDVD
jgi:transcriptional regulator with XRE-family HTH domain